MVKSQKKVKLINLKSTTNIYFWSNMAHFLAQALMTVERVNNTILVIKKHFIETYT